MATAQVYGPGTEVWIGKRQCVIMKVEWESPSGPPLYNLVAKDATGNTWTQVTGNIFTTEKPVEWYEESVRILAHRSCVVRIANPTNQTSRTNLDHYLDLLVRAAVEETEDRS